MTTITYESLMETIGQVAAAERITKEGLRTLSRDILAFVVETEDVRPVNALLGKGDDAKFILTPINWRTAVQYFHHFIPFTSNFDAEVREYAINGKGNREPMVFGKKAKKRWDKGVAAITEWLEDPSNDIWSWSGNIKMDGGAKDWEKEIQKAVLNATGHGKAKDQGDMSLRDVMAAMCELEEISIHDLMGAMDGLTVPEAEQEAA